MSDQISDVCSFGTELSYVQYSIDVVVGEFTGAQTDCSSFGNSLRQGTKYLNGYGIGARYDGTLDNAVH
jgi:hypothetical protein